jgi:DNA repair protein RadA/Sms
MAKISSVYVCQQCSYQSPSYLGKCPECGSWNSLVEQVQESVSAGGSRSKRIKRNIELLHTKDIDKKDYVRLSSRIEELDRVLGGGIVYGSVILVAGDPGIGKSTLLSQLSINVENVLYIAGEESAQQIKLRIERIDPKANLTVLNETDVDVIVEAIERFKPKMVIVDSIQTMETAELSSAAGSVSQVRETAHRVQKVAKALHIPTFIVGHVTKEGAVAGPKTLEHLVDVVLSLEGDANNNYRVLRSTKNRFGPTDEVGILR